MYKIFEKKRKGFRKFGRKKLNSFLIGSAARNTKSYWDILRKQGIYKTLVNYVKLRNNRAVIHQPSFVCKLLRPIELGRKAKCIVHLLTTITRANSKLPEKSVDACRTEPSVIRRSPSQLGPNSVILVASSVNRQF